MFHYNNIVLSYLDNTKMGAGASAHIPEELRHTLANDIETNNSTTMHAHVAEFKETLKNKNVTSPDIKMLVKMCDNILNHTVSLEGLNLKNIE